MNLDGLRAYPPSADLASAHDRQTRSRALVTPT